VLYEMLTGQRAFGGEDITDTIVAVVSREPHWTALPPSTPAAVMTLLARCLEKNAIRRLPHIGVARLELEDPSRDSGVTAGSHGAVPARSRWVPHIVAIVVALAVVIGGAAGAAVASRWTAGSTALRPATTEFLVPPQEGGELGPVAVSPDGRMLVFASQGALWLRTMSDARSRRIEGSAGGAPQIL